MSCFNIVMSTNKKLWIMELIIMELMVSTDIAARWLQASLLFSLILFVLLSYNYEAGREDKVYIEFR